MIPSTSPGSWPLSFNACWIFFTSSLPAALLDRPLDEDISEEDEPDDEEDMPVSLD
jgi:hypothetical protein